MMFQRTNAVIVLVVALCWHFELTNSRTSTLWKLNSDSGKITSGFVSYETHNHNSENNIIIEDNISQRSPSSTEMYDRDDAFLIITSTTSDGSNWVRQSPEAIMDTASGLEVFHRNSTKRSSDEREKSNDSMNGINIGTVPKIHIDTSVVVDETLHCGKPVNFTYYDYLIGVSQRFNHPLIPEPEVAYLFLKTKDENSYKNFDITALERRLKRAKREKPRSVQLYNQIGNYWRIIGDSRQAIECFRRALAMSPNNAEVILNLARVLYHLQYLDDAIHLTRRSLELTPPGRSAWQQYFTLGEIFKAYGHFQESILHLRHALELCPHHEPILKALRDVENNPSSTLHVYTVVIIAALVIAVFVVIITSSSNQENFNITNIGKGGNSGGILHNDYELKTQRHFNRAMAMRSLKGLSTTRHFKHRKN